LILIINKFDLIINLFDFIFKLFYHYNYNMDSIKKKLSKIKFDSIIKFFIITLVVLSIFLLIRYLLNKKKIELFNVDQDNCEDKYLLNYGDKSISSILIDKDIRYGFFNDIKKVKNNYYDTLVSVKQIKQISDDEEIKKIYALKDRYYSDLKDLVDTYGVHENVAGQGDGTDIYNNYINPMYANTGKLLTTNNYLRDRILEIDINLYEKVYESQDKSMNKFIDFESSSGGEMYNLIRYVCSPHSFYLTNNNKQINSVEGSTRNSNQEDPLKLTKVEYSTKMKELQNLDAEFLSILDKLGETRIENFVSSLKLFIIDSFENPVIVTPAEFKFINNDKKYPVLKGGYDFNNVIFLFKINNFTGSSNQDYGTIFDNSIFELRLITKNTNSNKKLFNLLLINKFSKDNNGFMLDPEITNIELNKYYYIRISVIDAIPNYSNDVCLTLIEVEKNIYGDTLYQKTKTFENSKIQNIVIDSSNNSGGILKCENTAIGRKVSQLELSGDVLTNSVPSLNMDFGFIKIGGGSKVNINMMPDPPITTTTTTKQVEFDVKTVKIPEKNELRFELAFNHLNRVNNIYTTDSMTYSMKDKFTNINTTDDFSNIHQNINIEHFSNNESSVNLINLTGILNFLNEKIEHHEKIIKNYKLNSRELISLFHVNYLKLIRDNIERLIKYQRSIGNCPGYSVNASANDTNCYISKYLLKDEMNSNLKNILTEYINKTFNTEKNGSNNDFIKTIITDEELYKSEPQNIQNEINDLINTLINDYNLNIDFTINLKLDEEYNLIVDNVINDTNIALKGFSMKKLLKIEKEMEEANNNKKLNYKQKQALKKIKDAILTRNMVITQEMEDG
jgi:hypothetical protein